MSSIYRRALGAKFDRLHPQMQRRLGINSSDGIACVGRGVMDEIWHGPFYVVPFLYLGSWRRILFPTAPATSRSPSRITPMSTGSGARP